MDVCTLHGCESSWSQFICCFSQQALLISSDPCFSSFISTGDISLSFCDGDPGSAGTAEALSLVLSPCWELTSHSHGGDQADPIFEDDPVYS